MRSKHPLPSTAVGACLEVYASRLQSIGNRDFTLRNLWRHDLQSVDSLLRTRPPLSEPQAYAMELLEGRNVRVTARGNMYDYEKAR